MAIVSVGASLEVGKQPWRHRHLIKTLAARELSSRFRGSVFGGLWAILQPMAVVAIFYYVFVVIFRARWSSSSTSDGDFIVGMFIGLMVYNILAEAVVRSTSVISGNSNYVKRVVFPITILPIVQMVFALTNFSISFAVLLLFGFFWGILTPSTSWLLLPLCLVPVVLWGLGLSWFVAALNVYFRDISVIVPIALQAMMFLSPVFYNLDSIPANAQALLSWSPLAMSITELRRVMMYGQAIDIVALLVPAAMGVVVMLLGYGFFRKVKPGFADVL